MARSRLPDRPPNGIGFGIHPKLVPKPLNEHDAFAKLTRPFRVPYKVTKPQTNGTSSSSSSSSGKDLIVGGRVLRRRTKTVSYAELPLPGDAKDENNYGSTSSSQQFDDPYTGLRNRRLPPRKDALSSHRLLEDPQRMQRIESMLRRSFTVPIKGYVQRHSLPLVLGTKRRIVPEPRPLHDPTDEFAIVLYDPSVDGDMVVTDSSEVVEVGRQPPKYKKGKSKEEEELERQRKEAEEKRRKRYMHPTMLSNGLRNKTLRELLGSPDDADMRNKKFPNVPVVIDPKLAKILRPHQVEGVKFLYRCVTGLAMKDYLDAEKVKSDVSQLSSDTDAEESKLSTSQQVEPRGQPQQDPEVVKSEELTIKTKTEVTEDKPEVPSLLQELEQHINRGAYGCIMADEMGLGKTLQCITLMWTLLKQGPQGRRLIDKCIIVCPSSLVNNWANELVKWLGPGAISPLAIDGKKSSLGGANTSVAESIHQWAMAKGRGIVKPVLIISYETLRRNVDQLGDCQVGLLLADEGHRLKNCDSLTFTALDSIRCPRRIILSGTPIQNDLSEYFALLNFSNPGLLGTRSDFRRNFEIPILRGRDADATDKEISRGEAQLAKLSSIVSKFIIRRTNDILSKYLPCKYEHVIFVKLKPVQRQLYQQLLKSRSMKKLVDGSKETQPLKAIGVLKKLCNHPNLLGLKEEKGSQDLDEDLLRTLEENNLMGSSSDRSVQTEVSGKFAVLERFLDKIKRESDEKIVLISNYTQTLDLIERMCRYKHYSSVRLDGTMSINKRQKLVDRFNDPQSEEFIFLLSSKAGGCGINLIGANRLILMDPDWNPAADQQALARVWRDGQRKDCFIYRFISTGTIEEKIYQRQSMKMSLSSCVVDAKEDVERLFSADNLRQLFQFNERTVCDTHETYHCKRCNKFNKQMIRAPTMLYGDATTWNHINHDALQKTNDHLLRNEYNYDDISFAFQYISH